MASLQTTTEINEIAKASNLLVLEDAAQSFGATYKGNHSCNLADIAATSFFPAKPLGCYGDGGAVFTNNEDIAKILKSLRVHGKGHYKYDNVRTGLNGRLDTLQAAILLPKLDIFPEEINKRQEIAKRYSEGLMDIVQTPYTPEGYSSAWAQYSVLSNKKEALMARLKENQIPTAVHYPKPLHLQTAFSYLGHKEGDFPFAEKCSEDIFSLPMYPYLKKEDIYRVVNWITG